MAKTGEDADGLLETASETQVLNAPADNLSGDDLAQFYDRKAEIEEALLYENNDSYPGLLTTPTFGQTQSVKQKLSEEDQKRKAMEAAEEKRREEALSVEKYQAAMDGIITQENDLLTQTASMQSQIDQLKKKLDENTITVKGQRVYVQGDHFVDKNGNSVSKEVEEEAERQLKLHPDAATWDQKTKIDEAERKVKEAAAGIQRHAEADQYNRDHGASQTPDQRRDNQAQAGTDLGHDQTAIADAGKAVGVANKSFSPGISGMAPTSLDAATVGAVLPASQNIVFGHDQTEVEASGKASTVSVVPPTSTTHTTSFSGGILPIEGKGDLVRDFKGPSSGGNGAGVVFPVQTVAVKADGVQVDGSLKTNSPNVVASTELSIKEKGELAAYFHGVASGQNVVPAPTPDNNMVANAGSPKDKDKDPLVNEFAVAAVGQEDKDSVPGAQATTSTPTLAPRPQTVNA